jgi:DNA-binding HxlR family transcriptional regulator
MKHAAHDETDCPMTRLIGIISSKWAMPVLYNLLRADAPVRFGALRQSIGHVTQRELSLTLKRFEKLAIVNRQAYAEVPPRVEYSLTHLGRSLEEPIMALGRWGEKNAHLFEANGCPPASRAQPAAAKPDGLKPRAPKPAPRGRQKRGA